MKGESINARMSRLGHNEVADKVTAGAVLFVSGLFTWMINMYTGLVAEQGSNSEVEVWTYIAHAVRNIFRELHNVRHYSAGEEPAVQAWYALKAYKLQEELLDKELTNHDIILKVMHQHLKHNVMTKTVYTQEMAELRKDLLAHQIRIQKLEAKTKK